MRFSAFHQRSKPPDIGFGRSATSTDDVHQALIDVLFYFPLHFFGSLVVLSQRIGKPGIGICTDIIRRAAGKLLQEWLQLSGTERTVQPDREDIGMLHRSQECVKRLSRKGTSARIRDRDRKHQRHLASASLHRLFCGTDSRLRIQGIKNGFYQNRVYPTFQQCRHLFQISPGKPVESQGTVSRIVHIGTHRAGLVGRAYRPCHPTRLLRILCRIFIGKPACQTCRLTVDFRAIPFQMIICHRHTGGIEGIGLDNIGTCLQVFTVDICYHIRTGQAQHIVAPFQHAGHLAEPFSTKILFCQSVLLNHGSHRPVQHQDTFVYLFLYCFHCFFS